MSLDDKLDAAPEWTPPPADGGVKRRQADDLPRAGDGTPWRWDGVELTKQGKPRLRPAGRPSNSGAAVAGGFGLVRYREGFVVRAVALMMPELLSQVGPYPELWRRDKATLDVLYAALEEGLRRAGYWTKADRGTLVHKVLQRVVTAMIEGTGSGAEVELGDLTEEAVELGLTPELLVEARSAFVELLTTTFTPLASEVHVYNPRFNKLGTADLVLQALVDVGSVRAGEVVGADLKTGRVDELTEVEHAAQLAAYFGPDSVRYVLTDDLDDPGHPEPWAWPLRRDTALIIQLPLDLAISTGDLLVNLHQLDLDEGTRVLELADEVARFKLARTGGPLGDGPLVRRQVDRSQLLDDLEASIQAATHRRVVEWLGIRLRAIVAHPLGPPQLVELWPDASIPRGAVKERTLTPEQVEPIDRLLNHIEREIHIPFPPNDPRRDLRARRKV